MADKLQQHFDNISLGQPNLRRLHSQWQFDKELIPKALQTIGSVFPHYSRHDQSHSDQILVNIERLLGEDRIQLLSATDTWLLLEAAYWHDIGMVVPHQALEDALKDPAFENYRLQVAGQTGHELQKFASHFSSNVNEAFGGADTPLDAMSKFRVFMAEWFRRKHHTRAENAINDPWQAMGLSSPRTELIPKRLFRLLGQICAMHGRSFDAVVGQLPFKETGMANDDCHPRYIACLLRLGDLLDIDDNRFCPVMQQIAGEGRPALSKAHEDKHASIRHFRLDPERIEVTAVCSTVDGYVEQWRWLDGLRTEVQKQMSCWQDIAPDRRLGLLPTIGEIKVEIAERKLLTEPGSRTEFRLNSARALKLLQGENLYKRTDTIRELLQNAVDATLLRIWQTERAAFDSGQVQAGDFAHPCFKKYPVEITLERSPKPVSAPDKISWRLTVTDQGAGISQDDLRYLMNVAGSGANAQRQAIVQSMPVWLRPSGNFGIGLQSVFMWTDVVHMRTKNLQTNEALEITLHNPSGPRLGLVEIERCESDHLSMPIGTQLQCHLETAATHYIPNVDETSPVRDVLRNHDLLLDPEMQWGALELIHVAAGFSKHSPVQVNWRYVDTPHRVTSEQTVTETSDPWDFFPETNCKFNATLLPKSSPQMHHGAATLYRGQPAEYKGPYHYSFLDCQIDLFADTASDWLTFDRNTWSTRGKDEMSGIVEYNTMLWVTRHKEQLRTDKKAELSALAKLNAYDRDGAFHIFWQALADELRDDWLELDCPVRLNGNGTQTACYRDILKEGWTLASRTDLEDASQYFNIPPEKLAHLSPIELKFCIDEWSKRPDHGIRYWVKNPPPGTGRYLPGTCFFQELVCIPPGDSRIKIDSADLSCAVEHSALQVGDIKMRLLAPIEIFPLTLGLDSLILQTETPIYGAKQVLPGVPYPTPHIVLPFEVASGLRSRTTITLNRTDEFYDWVRRNLVIPIPLTQVEAIYVNLIDFIDNQLMKDSTYWQKARATAAEL